MKTSQRYLRGCRGFLPEMSNTSRDMAIRVIPAKAGIQLLCIGTDSLDPGFRRGDNCETVKCRTGKLVWSARMFGRVGVPPADLGRAGRPSYRWDKGEARSKGKTS